MEILENTIEIVTPIPWYGVIAIAILLFFLGFMLCSDGFTDDILISAIVSGILTAVIMLAITLGTNLCKPRKQFYAKVSSAATFEQYEIIERLDRIDDDTYLYKLEEIVK